MPKISNEFLHFCEVGTRRFLLTLTSVAIQLSMLDEELEIPMIGEHKWIRIVRENLLYGVEVLR